MKAIYFLGIIVLGTLFLVTSPIFFIAIGVHLKLYGFDKGIHPVWVFFFDRACGCEFKLKAL